jgi:urease accessory protein
MSNPFLSTSASRPGHGTIHLALLLPNTPRLKQVSYQYPLKLISPSTSHVSDDQSHVVHTVYLLSYGGGLVAGDEINLKIILETNTRLVLLTQGSTKLFKAPGRHVLSKQCTTVEVAPTSALCYLPDPVQPFERSNFEQTQVYNILTPETGSQSGNLCLLDWVCNGRPANGEHWSFFRYGSRNEIYITPPDGKRRLLLRDNVILDDNGVDGSVATRMDGQAVFGTLILFGPLMESLREFFMAEFKLLSRIGDRKWDSGSDCGEGDEDIEPAVARRLVRQRLENEAGVLWSAASVRGCVVVKFTAPEVEAGKDWLRRMLLEEGSVKASFGERAFLCLR